jgi:hypothetical protein
MNCADFEKVVVALARGEAAEAGGAAHAEHCPRCARMLANERMLSELAAAAAAEDRERVAPPEVERALVAAFRDHQTSRPGPRTWWTRAAVGAIAATVMILAVVSIRRAPESPKTAVQPTQAHVAPVSLPAAAPAVVQPRAPRVKLPRAVRHKPAGPEPLRAALGREPMTDFIPIFYDQEPVERGQIVRVRLPRAALTAFGLPVNEEHAEEAIRADVLLGEDGLARAVRFVK